MPVIPGRRRVVGALRAAVNRLLSASPGRDVLAQELGRAQRLAAEHAVLRRVATLVAAGADPDDVCASVVAELGELCDAARTGLVRIDVPDSISIIALWSADGRRLVSDGVADDRPPRLIESRGQVSADSADIGPMVLRGDSVMYSTVTPIADAARSSFTV